MVPLFALLFAVGALVGFALLVAGLWEFRLAHRIRSQRPDPVMHAARGGSVELEGTVHQRTERDADGESRVLESPFTETPCVAYEYTVEEKRTRSTKNGTSTYWKEIASGSRAIPFRLDDGTGSVLVDPEGADFRLSSEGTIRVRGGEAPPKAVARFIERDDDVSDENRSMGIGPIQIATGRDRRYRERRLDVGGSVHILGTARHDPTVSREAGQINAVIERAESEDRTHLGRLRHQLFGPPYLIFDVPESGAARRVGLVGLVYTLAGTVILGVLTFIGFAWA